MTTRYRITAAAAALLAATTIASCSDDTTRAPSTSSTPSYDESIQGGNDPAYATGLSQVKALLAAPTIPELPASTSANATGQYIADANKTNKDFRTKVGITRMEGTATIPAWKGILLNRNTSQLSWHMELGVCQTLNFTAYNKAGKVVVKGPQTRLMRYTLTSADKGKNWLVDQSEMVPTEVPASRFDPKCAITTQNPSVA